MQEIRSYNKIELGSKIFNILILGFLIVQGKVTPATTFIAALLTLSYGFIFAFKRLKFFLKQNISPSLSTFKMSIPYGIKSFTGSLLWYLLLRIDLFMVDYMEGDKAAGLPGLPGADGRARRRSGAGRVHAAHQPGQLHGAADRH